MEIIDFERKGNIVRFYLGNSVDDYYGDDWDDTPYEHNAGKVYEEFITGFKDIHFEFDDIVLEPCCGTINSLWSKDDMKKRKIPCIIVVPKESWDKYWKKYEVDFIFRDFCHWLTRKDNNIKKYYFGDIIEL